MRKLIIIAVLTAILFPGSTTRAYSAVLDSQFIYEQVKKDIITQLKQDHDREIEVNIKSLPYHSLKVPAEKVRVITDIGNLNSISIVKVSLYVDEAKIKTFGVRAKIKIKDNVWVAKDRIRRGDTLKNLKMEKKEISSPLDKLPGKSFNPGEYIARRTIKPGDIVELNDIEPIPTIFKSSPVSVIFKTPTVSVTIPCIAVTSGKTGDFIKVKSKIYNRNYVGKIIGKNLVLVNI